MLSMSWAIRILRDRKRMGTKQLVTTDPKEAKTQGKPQCWNYSKGFLPGFHSNYRIRWCFHKWAKLRSLWCTSYNKYKAEAGQNPSLKCHRAKTILGLELSLFLQWKREGRRRKKWGDGGEKRPGQRSLQQWDEALLWSDTNLELLGTTIFNIIVEQFLKGQIFYFQQ